ncbi:MAG: hypothetical protein ACO252_07730, partial [Sediminibacterium sp.]
MKTRLLTFCGLLIFNLISAQNTNNRLNDYETRLIQVIQKDSADFSTTIDNNEFKFGTEYKGATFINIVKHHGQILVQPLGTGRLYEIVQKDNAYFS